jgi:ribA/ribD-fused uncharacterized protein
VTGPKVTRIKEFRGRYWFLSNFYVEMDGKTAEHRYQAAKTLDPEVADWIMDSSRPGVAKARGRHVPLPPKWDDIKIDVMRDVLLTKFRDDPHLRSQLIATGDAILEEGNSWGDTFWGIDIRTGIGENHLGILLMELRDRLNGRYTSRRRTSR